MTYSDNPRLAKVYAAGTADAQREAYNEWAGRYDADVTGFGIRLPYVGAAVFARYVELGCGPILDAGCGTGMHTLPLALMGYTPITGIDISDGMLEISKSRNIYSELRQMALGPTLDFPHNHFAAAYCIGVLAPGHAPPDSLNGLIRVTRPGGRIVFSVHAHDSPESRPFHDKRRALADAGLWTKLYQTDPFVSMPGGDASIQHAVYVYSVT